MFLINAIDEPRILAAENDFLLAYKPPRMHSAPLAASHGETILRWCSAQYPEIAALDGRKAGEGGLLHRLDYETQGLLLIARNKRGMNSLLEQQREGKIIKGYSALTAENKLSLPGFPPRATSESAEFNSKKNVQSAFRAYGPERKVVRPVLAGDGKPAALYTTEILEADTSDANITAFWLEIKKGFRHQIRAHLAWLGMPILNDNLYGGAPYGNGLLALRAHSITFNDPSSGEERSYSIPRLDVSEV